MEEKISKLVRKHLKLLQLERDESLQHFFKGISPAALHKFERNGQALTKLVVSSFANKGLKRFQIDFVNANESPLKHSLAIGDMVFCIQLDRKGQMLRGLVSAVSETIISISLNDLSVTINEEERFAVIKADSDFTHKCQTRALSNLEKKEIHLWPCFDIIRILFETDEKVVHDLVTAEISTQQKSLGNEGDFVFSNTNLAEDQKAAITFALRRKNIAIIQGPPGTGKTTTLVELIVQLCRLGKKVLVCAPTNVAVDNVVVKLGSTEVKPLRLGHPARIMETAQKYSIDANVRQDNGYGILQDIKQSIKEIREKSERNSDRKIRELNREYRERMNKLNRDVIRRHSVIVCTLNSATIGEGLLQHVERDYFNVVVIDEASQATEASNWIAIPNAEKLVLAGDINQLPPAVMSQDAAKGGLSLSLMERAMKKLGENSFRSLQIQYRMNNKIMSWSSEQFYKNSLKADQSVANHLLKDLHGVQDLPITSDSVLFVDTCGCECEEYQRGGATVSKGNVGEAVVVDGVVAALVQAGVPQEDIGVITPYALQVDFIQRLLTARSITAEVSTVDGFQGREKEVIVLSLVRSNEQKELGFVTDFRRLNVAVTRAKRLLAVIADSETVEKNELITSLLAHIEKHGLLQTAQEYLTDKSENIKTQLEEGVKAKQKPEACTEIKGEKKNKITTKTIGKNKETPSALKDKGIDLSINLNRKNYNPFECIQDEILDSFCMEDVEEIDEELTAEENSDVPENQHNKEVEVEEEIKVNHHSDAAKDEQNKEQTRKDIGLSNLIASLKTLQSTAAPGLTTAKEAVPAPSTSKLSNKRTKKKKPDETNPENDDEFDKIIASVTANDYICALQECNKSTRLMHIACEFCKRRYCLQHGMQEVHGCGDAVRQKEQKDFRHRKPESIKQKDKDKFARKLKQLEEARKPKKKTGKQ